MYFGRVTLVVLRARGGGGGGMDQVDSRVVQYGHRCMACSFINKRKTKFS